MPIIKSAKKALRQNRKRRVINLSKRLNLKTSLKKALKLKSAKDISIFNSLADKAAKTGIIHKNKAARLKSRLSHLSAK